MSTIPASQIVNVIPSVVSAGGTPLILNGLVLTTSTRIPTGTVQSFTTAASVSSFFGANATETGVANIYFQSYDNSTAKPGTILYSQVNSFANSAYLRSGPVTGYTIPQLQAVSGTLTVVIDGYSRVGGTLNLTGGASYTAIATIIQTALNTTQVTGASLPAGNTIGIASPAVAFTGSVNGYTLTVTAMTTGTIQPGGVLAGTGVVASTHITSQLSGTTGGIGTYALDTPQVIVSEALTQTYGVLTAQTPTSGTIAIGQTVTGGTTAAGTIITALGTGTGGAGTYIVNISQTVASTTMTTTSTPVTVTFDSQSGGFVITSGIYGTASTIAYATGTAAPLLFMTQTTGATLSQGNFAMTAAALMTNITSTSQNWATFMLAQDPDNIGTGSLAVSNSNVNKLAFATWTNTQNQRWCFVCWDTDVSPTTTVPASSSLGGLLAAGAFTGTSLFWGVDYTKAALACGITAGIDFTTVNGRITFAFKGQSGLVADVTSTQVAANLLANGYNFYGAYATANQSFIWIYNGQVSGPFKWLDSYINQIWLNNQFQLALMVLLQSVTSIPYNQAGYDLIAQAMQDPINAGLSFGAFRVGVPLSLSQVASVNNAAGVKIDTTLNQQGWYLQVTPASPQVRALRQTPPIKFWYMDGQAVQQITVNSIDVM